MDPLIQEELKSGKIKLCPYCSAPGELTSGCNYIKCPMALWPINELVITNGVFYAICLNINLFLIWEHAAMTRLFSLDITICAISPYMCNIYIPLCDVFEGSAEDDYIRMWDIPDP